MLIAGLCIGVTVGFIVAMVLFSMFTLGKEKDLQAGLIDILVELHRAPWSMSVVRAIRTAESVLDHAYGGERK